MRASFGSITALALVIGVLGSSPAWALEPPAHSGVAATPKSEAGGHATPAPSTKTERAAAHEAPAPAGAHGTVDVTQTATEKAVARPGSIAAAQAAVQRAVASVRGEKRASSPEGAAEHRAAPVAAPRGAAGHAPARPAKASPPAERGRTTGVVLQWADGPVGTRTLAWEPDIDPRSPAQGIRLTWRPDVP